MCIRDRVKSELAKVNGSRGVGSLSYRSLSLAAADAYVELRKLGISRRDAIGCEVVVSPSYPSVARRNMWRPIGTFATLTLFASGWFLTGLSRYELANDICQTRRMVRLTLTDNVKSSMNPVRIWTL